MAESTIRPVVLRGDRCEDLVLEHPACIRVGQHHGSPARRRVHEPASCETLVIPWMPEVRGRTAAFEKDAEAHVAPLVARDLPCQHLLNHCGCENAVRGATSGGLQVDRQPGQVRWCRPQASGRQLRVNAPLAGDRFSTTAVSAGRNLPAFRGQGLRESTVMHVTGLEHQLLHQRREGLSEHIHQQLLQDAVATAGVAEVETGHSCDADAWIVRRFGTVEHVSKRWNLLVGMVAGRPGQRDAGAVREQLVQRHPRLPPAVARNLPVDEVAVYILVEVESAILDQTQNCHCRYRLADRAGLEQGVCCNWRRLAHLAHAVALGPLDLTVVDDSDANTWHGMKRHTLGKRGPAVRRVIRLQAQAMLNAVNTPQQYPWHRLIREEAVVGIAVEEQTQRLAADNGIERQHAPDSSLTDPEGFAVQWHEWLLDVERIRVADDEPSLPYEDANVG